MYQRIKNIVKKLPFSTNIKNFLRRSARPAMVYFLCHTTHPLSNYYGLDRGKPIDRFYIENFLEQNKLYIQGVCLELLNNNYTMIYGGEKVTKSDILDNDELNKKATIIDDLRQLKKISDNVYDCIILTQVFQFIDDVDAGISECYRILKNGGVLLVTLPSLSRIDCVAGVEGDYWRFTEASARYLFGKKFNPARLSISTYGNARSGIYFYAGLAQEDTERKILEDNDHYFPLIITIKAIK